MKLGLIIKNTDNGESEGSSFNKDEAWAKYATDARSAIKELTNFDETGKTIFLLRFLGPLGYLICIVKARPHGSGRPFDNTAAWIHIPTEIEITGQQTKDILESVATAISGRTEIDDNKLNDFFDKEYETNNVSYSDLSSIRSKDQNDQNELFGVRYYNGDTNYQIHELLGEWIAQPEYQKYKGIFLIDKFTGITLPRGVQLKFNPKPLCSIPAPKDIDGFKAYIGKNPFVKEIRVTEGNQVDLTWIKQGYAYINKKFVASTKFNPNEINITPNEYKKIIQRSWFNVVDSNSNKQLTNSTIYINDRPIVGDKIEIAEAAFNSGVVLKISSQDYSDYIEHNFKIGKNITFRMAHKVHHYEFEIPAYDKDNELKHAVQLVIETKRRLSKSPIKGYFLANGNLEEGEGRINRLEFDNNLKIKIKSFAYGIIGCLLIELLIAGWSVIDDYEFHFGWPPVSAKVSHVTTPEIIEGGTEASTNIADSLAISYLDDNETWKKDSLNSNELTKGLYEDLDSFKLEDLKDKWADKLSKSKKFKDLVSAADECLRNGWDPTIGKNDKKYNSAKDSTINVDNYIKWISEEHKKINENNESKPVVEKTTSNKTKTSNMDKITGIKESKKEKTSKKTSKEVASEPKKRGGV